MLSLVHVVEWRASVNPDQVALTDDRGAELTYADLRTAMEASAAAFAAADIGPGDVVPVIARNQAGWVTAMLGLIRAGALPAAVNWRLAAPEVAALLGLMAPAAIVTDDDCAALVTAAGAAVPVLTCPGAAVAAPANGSPARPPQRPAAPLSWARERLAGFKCPTGVTEVPELPRNATGKVTRAALREPYWAGRDRRVS